MRNLLAGLLLLNALTFCSPKTDNLEVENNEEVTDKAEGDKPILGVWTDGSGPNASVRIEEDSIYDVEHFTKTKYALVGDTLIIYSEDEPFKAKIIKLDADSLIYISKYGETVMWRFKN